MGKKKADVWERWAKRLGVVVASITILSTLIAAGIWLHGKLTRRTALVVRDHRCTFQNRRPQCRLEFTIANNSDVAIYVDALHLVEGPLMVGALPPPFAATAVPEFYDRVYLSKIEIAQTNSHQLTEPVLGRRRLRRFDAVAVHRIFDGPRLRLEPTEHVDYQLAIDAAWPSQIDPNDLRDPQLGMRLVLTWEGTNGQPRQTTEFCNLLFF